MTNGEATQSLIPLPDGSLANTAAGARRVLSAMVGETLAVARDSAVVQVDFDAVVQEGHRLYLSKGEGMTDENIRAFKLFLQAAEAEHSEAQYLVSECYRLGHGAKQDEANALAWLKRSAESGFGKACLRLGVRFQHRGDDEAIKWYQKAVEAGVLGACLPLSDIYRKRGDLAGAIKWDKELALSGYGDSLWTVREFYENQDWAEVDLPEAYAWLTLFEDYYTAWWESEDFARFDQNPRGPAKYKTKVQDLKILMSEWEIDQGDGRYHHLVKRLVGSIRRKAESGSEYEQYRLGCCYREGYGVPGHGNESVRWWLMAAERGGEKAQNSLGYSYCMGSGVLQDYDKGAKWIRKAAESGDRVAQHNMGFLYEKGWGVPQDKTHALAWYRYAAEGSQPWYDYDSGDGPAKAKEKADSLAALMTPAELERANQLYRELKNEHPIRQSDTSL